MLRSRYLCWVLIFIIFSTSVSANVLSPQYSEYYQQINFVKEEVIMSNTTLFIKFDASMLIDPRLKEITDWVSFYYNPTFFSNDQIEDYKSTVNIRKKGQATDLFENNSLVSYNESNSSFVHSYNISIRDKNGSVTLIFNANYSMKGRIIKTGDFDYSMFYYDYTLSKNKRLSILVPNNLEPNPSFPSLKWTLQGSDQFYKRFEITGEDANEPLHLIFQNKDEKKALELKKKNEEVNRSVILGIIFTLLGALVGFVLTAKWDEYKERKLEMKKRPIKERALNKIRNNLRALLWDLLIFHSRPTFRNCHEREKIIEKIDEIIKAEEKEFKKIEQFKIDFEKLINGYSNTLSDLELKYGNFLELKKREIFMDLQFKLSDVYYSIIYNNHSQFVKELKQLFALLKDAMKEEMIEIEQPSKTPRILPTQKP